MKRFPLKIFWIPGFTLYLIACQLCASEKLLKSFQATVAPVLDNYCYDCHGLGVSEGEVTLDEFTAETIEDQELWFRVLKNARAHIMPPVEEAHPTDEERKQLATWIKSGPFGIDPQHPDPGKITVQRLNRVEYKNTIFDLMGIEYNTFDEFPADDSGEGFDNIGEILTLSPMMLEKYLDAAVTIVSEAVPTQSRVLAEHKLLDKELVNLFSPAPTSADEDDEELQMSFYSPSTRSADYQHNQSGDYQLVLNVKTVSFSSFDGFDYSRCRFLFKVDGEILLDQDFEYISGRTIEYTFDRNWQAGEHRLSFEVEPLSVDQDKIKDLKMRIEFLTIRGPMAPEFWAAPPNYETFFPGGVPENKSDRRRYSQTLLTDFATRAFRRPVDKASVNRLVKMAEAISRQEGYTYEAGISQAMVAVLASPRFLFREEDVMAKAWKDKHPQIDEYSLASRLSYFFWSTMPDEELFQLAEAGKLRANLEAQVRRMMADERSDNFINNFSGQWLHARDI